MTLPPLSLGRYDDQLKQLGKRAKLPKPLSKGEETLAGHLTAERIPYEREYKFHPDRKWRFDFAFVHHKIAVECEGGSYQGGRHQTPDGFENDLIKYNAAARLGWFVFRYTTRLVTTGVAIAEIRDVLKETAVTA